MTPRELKAARQWLLDQHAQADRTPDKRPNMVVIRTLMACVEAVQAATAPEPPLRVLRSLRSEVPPTAPGDYSPTLYAPSYARTELATVSEGAALGVAA